jgi:hypothetical protein
MRSTCHPHKGSEYINTARPCGSRTRAVCHQFGWWYGTLMTAMKSTWRWLNISKVEDKHYRGLEAITVVIMKDVVFWLGAAITQSVQRLAGRPREWSSSPGRGKNSLFSMSSRLVLWPTQPPIQWIPGDKAARAWSWLHLQVEPRSRKRGSIHPLPYELSRRSA